MAKEKKHKTTAKANKESNLPKYIFIGLSLLAVGAGAYLGYKVYRRRKAETGTSSENTSTNVSSATKSTSSDIVWRDDSFPLSIGSSGPKVLQLQRKMNSKYSTSLEPDGLFGPLTYKAIKMAGFNIPVDETTFSKITDGEATLVFDPRSLANRLLKFSRQRDLNATLVTLGEMKSVDHYKTVNFYFQILTLADSSINVRRTIVTHLLSHAFASESLDNKKRISDEFSRMGLIERDGKWALSGLGNQKSLITIRDTMVRDNRGNRIRVRKGTLLGRELYSSGPLTTFIAVDGTKGLVPATHVRYFKTK
jgi:hypothetical protein